MTKTLRSLFLLLAIAWPFAVRAQLSISGGPDARLCVSSPYSNMPDTVRLQATIVGGIAPYSINWKVYATAGGAQLPAATYLDDSALATPALLRNPQNSMQTADRDSIVTVINVTDASGHLAMDTVIVRYQRILACITGYMVYDKTGIDTFQVPYSGTGGDGCTENFQPLTLLYWTPGVTLVDSTASAPRSFANAPYATMYHSIMQDAIGCIYQNGDFGVFNGTTGIAKVLLKDVLHVFPQPATGKLYIDAGQLLLTSIRIYGMDGQLLTQTAYSGATKAILAINYLKTGSYLLEVQDAGGQLSHQVIAINQ